MANGWSKDAAERVAALISKANSDRLETELRPFGPLFSSLADKLSDVLQTYTSSPVKCSIARFSLERVPGKEFKIEGTPFNSRRGPLRLMLRAERNFDSMLCEICFGGSGSPNLAADEVNRPRSKIENFLRKMVFEAIHSLLPDTFASISDVILEPAEDVTTTKQQTIPSDLQCVVVSLLTNVFGLSVEIEVLHPLAELEAIFGAAVSGTKTSTKSMQDALKNCNFELVAKLQPQMIGLDRIVQLESGSVIVLEATPSHPTLVQIAGIEVAQGRLSITGEQIALSIL